MSEQLKPLSHWLSKFINPHKTLHLIYPIQSHWELSKNCLLQYKDHFLAIYQFMSIIKTEETSREQLLEK